LVLSSACAQEQKEFCTGEHTKQRKHRGRVEGTKPMRFKSIGACRPKCREIAGGGRTIDYQKSQSTEIGTTIRASQIAVKTRLSVNRGGTRGKKDNSGQREERVWIHICLRRVRLGNPGNARWGQDGMAVLHIHSIRTRRGAGRLS